MTAVESAGNRQVAVLLLHLLQFGDQFIQCHNAHDSMSTVAPEKQVDCKQFPPRLRSICEGTSGLPPEKVEKYRLYWAGHPVPQPPSRGLGDTVAWAIGKVTFGLVKPCCACGRRRAWLNRVFPYRHG